LRFSGGHPFTHSLSPFPMHPTILGIDPGTKEMGIAVIRGTSFIAGGVKTLRNGERPHDVIGQARRVVLSYIEDYSPTIVAIEKPLLMPTKRAALVSVIAQELHARSREVGTKVIEISPREARRIVVGNPYAKKLEVARAIVAMGFEELREKLPQSPPHPVLGYRPRDKYWLHMFDALAVAVAAEPTTGPGGWERRYRQDRPA
jgi:Holliday junction resolvasome RuvABC endonuclease subunit